MLYQGENLHVNWLENGIAELVFDAPAAINKLDTKTVASLGRHSTCLKTAAAAWPISALHQSRLYRRRRYY